MDPLQECRGAWGDLVATPAAAAVVCDGWRALAELQVCKAHAVACLWRTSVSWHGNALHFTWSCYGSSVVEAFARIYRNSNGEWLEQRSQTGWAFAGS